MKKLSTLIALALVITIGGVFAAWHYSIGAVDSLQIGPGLQMTTVETTLRFSLNEHLALKIHP